MQKVVRALAAAAVVAAAILAAYRTAWVPYRHDAMKKEIASRLQTIHDRSGGSVPVFTDVVALREDVARLRTALRYAPTDPVLHMHLAGAYHLLGLYADEVAQLQRMLRHHRRPEIYLALANAQFAIGDTRGAITNYAHVVAFYPPKFDLMSTELREPVRRRVHELYGDVDDRLRVPGSTVASPPPQATVPQ